MSSIPKSDSVLVAFLALKDQKKKTQETYLALWEAAKAVETAQEEIKSKAETIAESMKEIIAGRKPWSPITQKALELEQAIAAKTAAENMYLAIAKAAEITIS